LDAAIKERLATLDGWTFVSAEEYDFQSSGNLYTLDAEVEADFSQPTATEVFNIRYAMRDNPTLAAARTLVFEAVRLFADKPVDGFVIRNFVSSAKISDRRKDDLGFVEITLALRVEYDADNIVYEEGE
jgi:hypothetical protein